MPEIYEYPHTVRPEEIDALGHANNVVYVEWMQAAALAHSAAQGWPEGRYRQLGRGWVVRSHRIEYHQPARAADQIVVQTWVATMRKVASERHYRIVRLPERTLLATAETKWAFIDYATGQPVRIPQEVSQAFFVVDEGNDQSRITNDE